MKFMNDKQRKAAFRNMKEPSAPSVKNLNTKSGLDSIHEDLFGRDKNTDVMASMFRRHGSKDAFGHMRIKL